MNHPPVTRETQSHYRSHGESWCHGAHRCLQGWHTSIVPITFEAIQSQLHLCVLDELGAVCVLNCSSEELRDQVAVVSFICCPTATALSLQVPSRTHPPIASSALRVRYKADDVLRDNVEDMKTFLVCLICNLAEVFEPTQPCQDCTTPTTMERKS